MPYFDYQVKTAKMCSNTIAQFKSIVWPILGSRKISHKSIISNVRRLMAYHKKRLISLRAAGYYRLAVPECHFAVSICPPAMVKTASHETVAYCNCVHVCPWCYARRVEEVFNSFSNLLPKRGGLRNGGVNLLEIIYSRTLDGNSKPAELATQLDLLRQLQFRHKRRLDPFGGYYDLIINPIMEDKEPAYELAYRMLSVMPNDFVVPRWLDIANTAKLTNINSKKELISIVTRICKYPVGIMKGSAKMAVISLHARRGIRCNEFFGCFRSQSSDEVLSDDNSEQKEFAESIT